MRNKIYFCLLSLLFLVGCKATYERARVVEHVRQLAQQDYQLELDVKEWGNTIGVEYVVDSLSGQMLSADQTLWKDVENILMTLRRVCLSMDKPPQFFVLDIVDQENPLFRLVFTRYVKDVRKVMAEAISVNHYFDSMVMEVVIGEERQIFDPQTADITTLILNSMKAETQADSTVDPATLRSGEVNYLDFLANVASNRMRRLLRERKDLQDRFILRDVSGTFSFSPSFDDNKTDFNLLVDLVSIPGEDVSLEQLKEKIFPTMIKKLKEIFHIYRYADIHSITVLEKNSGTTLTLPKT